MPVYNAFNFLEKSVESVSKQTLKDIELICINDGSTDNSLELLNQLREKYDFLKIITQENQGSGIARNVGIKNAKGEYIAFLDADDEFLDVNALEIMYESSNINNADIISANLQMINQDNKIVQNFFYSKNDYKFFTKKDVISPEEYGLPLSFYKNIFRRDFIIQKEIYFPNLKRGQDPPFLAKAIVSTSEIPVVPVNLYGHHYKIGGGAENKVNTYGKKYDYISHFRLTFEILDKKGYFDLANDYKKKLFIYLNGNFKEDSSLEGFNILVNVFGNDEYYFEGFENNIRAFKIEQLINHLDITCDDDFFDKVKNIISNSNIWSNKLLPIGLLKKCFLLLSVDSLKEYKDNYLYITGEKDVNLTLFNKKDMTNNSLNLNLGNFSKFITARIDIKNYGNSENDIEIIENSDINSDMLRPGWFKDNAGNGTQIQSINGSINLKIKCINDGKLNITLKGIFYKNDYTNNLLPILINYEKFIIDNTPIIEKPIIVWHDEPFIYEVDVKNNEIKDIFIQWSEI